MGFDINQEVAVHVDGHDVAIRLGHDMDHLIEFIAEIDMHLQDEEFPRAVLKWAERAVAEDNPPASAGCDSTSDGTIKDK